LKHSLGCPPDEIEVHERDGLDSGHGFVTLFRFKMCQKRLRILQNVNAEFVAGCVWLCPSVCLHTDMMTPIPAGRIWWLRIYLGALRKWCVWCGLSEHSLPVRPEAVFLIKAQRGGWLTRPQTLRMEYRLSTTKYMFLVPEV
jgi:hypothetical protein